MPRPRFSLRWSIVIVAVAAILLGTEAMRRRRADYLSRADVHASIAEKARHFSAAFDEDVTLKGLRPITGPEILKSRMRDREHWDRFASYEDRLSRKYSLAARTPWLPVAPDPPRAGVRTP